MPTKCALIPTWAIALVSLSISAIAQSQLISKEELARRAIERRAVEAVIWGMPAVNYERMLQAAIDNGAKLNQVVYWSRPVNAKNQTLTPNPDTIYLNPFYDTTGGPVVVEVPPADADHVIVGSFDVAWQNALADVGPAGSDKGKGAKYLITPPGYRETPPDGYIVLPSETYRGFVILRSNFKSRSDADIRSAVDHGKRIVLSSEHQRPRGCAAGRWQDVPSHGAGERPGRAVLVGDGLRP